MTDGQLAQEGPWVCGNCRSINSEGMGRCYSCRTPRALAVKPDAVEAPRKKLTEETPPAELAAAAREVGASYRPTATWAAIAQVAVLIVTAIALARIVLLVATGAGLEQALSGDDLDPGLEQLAALPIVRYLELGAWFLGLVAWGAWLGRVVANVPALGGGWPHATPRSAFLTTLIPGGNLYWTTSILREAITRLSPFGSPRLGVITAWWLALTPALVLLQNIGPLRIVRRIVETVLLTFLAITDPTGEEVIRAIVLLDILGAALLVVAAFLAIRLVQVVERLQAERVELLGLAPGRAETSTSTSG